LIWAAVGFLGMGVSWNPGGTDPGRRAQASLTAQFF
jgi:hypothetical protein